MRRQHAAQGAQGAPPALPRFFCAHYSHALILLCYSSALPFSRWPLIRQPCPAPHTSLQCTHTAGSAASPPEPWTAISVSVCYSGISVPCGFHICKSIDVMKYRGGWRGYEHASPPSTSCRHQGGAASNTAGSSGLPPMHPSVTSSLQACSPMPPAGSLSRRSPPGPSPASSSHPSPLNSRCKQAGTGRHARRGSQQGV